MLGSSLGIAVGVHPLLSREQMNALERHAIEHFGMSERVLVEVAGRAVAKKVDGLAGPKTISTLCLAGTGNNGADAVVVGRSLALRGHPVTVVVLGSAEALSAGCREQVELANRLGLETLFFEGEQAPDRVAELVEAHEMVVDGIFGLGLNRPVEGWMAQVLNTVDVEAKQVVAIDIPSGVDANTGVIFGSAIRADFTISFQFPKLGHALQPGRELSGELEVVDIGIPVMGLSQMAPVAEWLDLRIVAEVLSARSPTSHKGDYGHLAVVAGTPERPGSAMLAARAAARSGAGLVTIGSDEDTVRRLSSGLMELMSCSLGTNIEAGKLSNFLSGKAACVFGPSLAPDEMTLALIEEVLLLSPVPLVLDAGGISALGENLELLAARNAPTVITPHPGEAARLLGVDAARVQVDRVRAAVEIAQKSQSCVVLKGASTVIADPDGQVSVSTSGGPALATAGTGDVLAGIIGGFMAQGYDPSLASRAAAHLHGVAGDAAADEVGEAALVASDLLRFLNPKL